MAQEQKPRMPGGMGNLQSAAGNAEVQGYLDQVRTAAQESTGRTFAVLEAVEFATQLVNGINYFIKAHTGEGKFIFVRLHKPFQGDTVKLSKAQDGKAETDVLVYF